MFDYVHSAFCFSQYILPFSGSKKHHTTPPKKETLNNLAETNVIPVHEDRGMSKFFNKNFGM